MSRDYRVEWIGPGHARRVAHLERLIYPKGQRTGREGIAEQLSMAEAAGKNLSTALFNGSRMVGYCLRFLETDRRRICAYIDIAEPPGIDLSGPGVYMADIAVHPRHRKDTGLLIARMAVAGQAREDLRGLPMEAFSTQELANFWRRRTKALARVGLRLVKVQEFQDDSPPQTLYWLQFEYGFRTVARRRRTLQGALKSIRDRESPIGVLRVGVLDSLLDWELLEPYWDRLLAQTSGATVFCSYTFLRVWWRQLVLSGDLLLVVVVAGDNAIAIAPMQILPQRCFGREYRCLGFLGHPSEVDRPVLIAPEHEEIIAQTVTDYLMAERDCWDSVILYEQPLGGSFLRAMASALRSAGKLVDLPQGPVCPRVDVSGDWQRYLAGRSRSQRKSARRHVARLGKAGELILETVEDAGQAPQAFERYAKLEARSWKPAAGLGVAKSSVHRAFWRILVGRYADAGAAHFRFLVLNGRDIAASFGLLWNQCFYSLHIVHDEDFAHYSPGFVLTFLELQHAFERSDYHWVDYLGGFLANKRGWATETLATTALYAHPRDLAGRSFHGYSFRVKPYLKRQLSRMGALDAVFNAKKALVTRYGWNE